MCTVAAASGAASVRVRHVMSRGWDPWTERPLPEGVRVAYPLAASPRRPHAVRITAASGAAGAPHRRRSRSPRGAPAVACTRILESQTVEHSRIEFPAVEACIRQRESATASPSNGALDHDARRSR